MYKLCAVVEHLGLVPTMGHYLAYRKLIDSKKNSFWVQANDDDI